MIHAYIITNDTKIPARSSHAITAIIFTNFIKDSQTSNVQLAHIAYLPIYTSSQSASLSSSWIPCKTNPQRHPEIS